MVKVVVVGAGIIGTVTAFQVKNEFPDIDVTIVAEAFTPNITSDGAAGLFVPPHITNTTREVIRRWSAGSHQYAMNILKSPDAATMGISIAHGYLLSAKDNMKIPDWSDIVLNFRVLSPNDLKQFPPHIKSGCAYSAFITEPLIYIPSLSKQFIEKGGEIIQQKVTSIHSLFDTYDIVINCSGLGAGKLVDDEKVFPMRGQIIRVKAPWLKEWVHTVDIDDDGRLAYAIPLQNMVVLGGIKRKYNDNMEISQEDRDWILKSTQEIIPSLKNAEFISDWVGLRPGRDSIRLEKEIIDFNSNGIEKRGIVIHNYGHGGNGITLSWGCGEDVVELVRKCIFDNYSNTIQSKL